MKDPRKYAMDDNEEEAIKRDKKSKRQWKQCIVELDTIQKYYVEGKLHHSTAISHFIYFTYFGSTLIERYFLSLR